MYDADIARWFVPDPMNQHYSPYLAMGNNPISGIDPTRGEDGDVVVEDDIVTKSANNGADEVNQKITDSENDLAQKFFAANPDWTFKRTYFNSKFVRRWITFYNQIIL
jgi:hypothetical protein